MLTFTTKVISKNNYMKIYFISILLLTACINTEHKTKNITSSEIQQISLDESNSCNYSGTLDLNSVYSFKSDAEAVNALNSIMKHTGLPTNFFLVAADVDNAAAAIYQNKRFILYNQRFMEEVKNKTHSKFAPLSILSHEIGHHLSGHTLLEADARPNLELEADRFSGFILAKMGASLEETCIAMEIYGSNTASATHPSKRTRISAIVNGWKEAIEDNQNKSENEVVSHNNSQVQYIIDVVGEAKYITLRNRSLNSEEYKLGNTGTKEGNDLNRETIIMNLPNGTVVEVLSTIGKTYYVRAKTENGEVLGYIVKSFAGQPTIKKM